MVQSSAEVYRTDMSLTRTVAKGTGDSANYQWEGFFRRASFSWRPASATVNPAAPRRRPHPRRNHPMATRALAAALVAVCLSPSAGSAQSLSDLKTLHDA